MNPFRGESYYRIHYYQDGKLIKKQGRWTYGDAESFLKRTGYRYSEHAHKYLKLNGHTTAQIVHANGIPF